jgi:hypothetical protein
MICTVYSKSLELSNDIKPYIRCDSDKTPIKQYTLENFTKYNSDKSITLRTGIGTLFTINDRLFVITCSHVIGKNSTDVYAMIDTDKVPLQIFNIVPEIDLAILEIIDDKYRAYQKENILKINDCLEKLDSVQLKLFDDVVRVRGHIINDNVKSNIVSKLPLIKFTTDEIKYTDVKGLSGSPLILDNNLIGMVFSYLPESNEFEALPFSLLVEILYNSLDSSLYYAKGFGGYYFSSEIVDLDSGIVGHFIISTKDVSYIRKIGSIVKKDFKFKVNDIILKINDCAFNMDGTIYNDRIGCNVTLETHLMLYAYFDSSVKYDLLRGDDKLIVCEIYARQYDHIYNLNIFNNDKYVYWKGLIFAELSEELIINMSSKYKLLGDTFQKYKSVTSTSNNTSTSNKNVVLIDVIYEDLNLKTAKILKDINAPYVNVSDGYELLVLEKIGNKKIINIDDLYKYISTVNKSKVTCCYRSVSHPSLKIVMI